MSTVAPGSAVPDTSGSGLFEGEAGATDAKMGAVGGVLSSVYERPDIVQAETFPARSTCRAKKIVVVSRCTLTWTANAPISSALPLATGSPRQLAFVKMETVAPGSALPLIVGLTWFDGEGGAVSSPEGGRATLSCVYVMPPAQFETLPAASVAVAEIGVVLFGLIGKRALNDPAPSATVKTGIEELQSGLPYIRTDEPGSALPRTVGFSSVADGDGGSVLRFEGGAGAMLSAVYGTPGDEQGEMLPARSVAEV
jgi:hypothetical protein